MNCCIFYIEVKLSDHTYLNLFVYRPSSAVGSYEDLSENDVVTRENDVVEMLPQRLSADDRETALLAKHVPRLVRQSSTMETPLDSSGSMKMTYWF